LTASFSRPTVLFSYPYPCVVLLDPSPCVVVLDPSPCVVVLAPMLLRGSVIRGAPASQPVPTNRHRGWMNGYKDVGLGFVRCGGVGSIPRVAQVPSTPNSRQLNSSVVVLRWIINFSPRDAGVTAGPQAPRAVFRWSPSSGLGTTSRKLQLPLVYRNGGTVLPVGTIRLCPPCKTASPYLAVFLCVLCGEMLFPLND
jgi:hypothetical protein